MKKSPASRKITQREIKRIARKIRLLVLDVDGVLTDGSIILDNEGNEYKSFHVRDGHGIKMLQRAGVNVAIITGRQSKVVERRAAELGIKDVFQKCFNKIAAYEDLIRKYSLAPSEVAYMGDDIVDAPVMSRVGLPVSVADADQGIRKFSLFVTKCRGGRGAVREVTDCILDAKGLLQGILDEYLEA
ncbi:MAG: 3-deoxy-manno-octulosonate-8-phosphatase KdsC [Nitrospiraceae bacterium]|nr:3-deoxy-manno-octulosonate-8-phosphatase KdsC [Nitrospiraceae bacterium]